LGHLARWPAKLSGAEKFLPQPSQCARRGIGKSPEKANGIDFRWNSGNFYRLKNALRTPCPGYGGLPTRNPRDGLPMALTPLILPARTETARLIGILLSPRAGLSFFTSRSQRTARV